MPNTTYGTPYVASSDLVSAYPGVSSTLATRVDEISLKGNGLNNQTGTTYTLVLTDGGKTVTLSNASAVTVTIPTNTSVAFPLGTEINFVNKGAGTVTIQPTGGVTLNGGNLTLGQFAAVQLVKLDTNTWGQLDSVATTPGLVLVSPSSIANSGGSASASGGAVTFSGVSSVSLNGVFTSTYANYLLVIDADLSADVSPALRMRASGSDTTSSYIARVIRSDGTTVSSLTSTTLAFAGSGGERNFVATWTISNPNVAAVTLGSGHFYGDSVSAAYVGTAGFKVDNTTQYDGFTLYPSSGTITGTVRVYGYRN